MAVQTGCWSWLIFSKYTITLVSSKSGRVKRQIGGRTISKKLVFLKNETNNSILLTAVATTMAAAVEATSMAPFE